MFEVFQCGGGNSLKKLFSKGGKDQMFLQMDDSTGEVKIKGKAYIANDDGKNEYVSQFDYSAKDITSVTKGEFQGTDALILSLKIKSMYGGTTKVKIFIPNLGANLNRAIGLMSNYVKEI